MINSDNNKGKTKQSDVEITDSENNTETSQDTARLGASEIETIARDIKEGRLSCFVGNDSSLDGELNFRSMARIDGHLTGKINSEKGTLIIGVSGQVDANVAVATAIIKGTINGDVVTAEHLELKSTAKVVGNIRTPRLVMEDGAILEGNIGMLKREEKPENPVVKQVAAAAGGTTFRSPLAVKQLENSANDKKSEPVESNKDATKLTLDVI